MFSHRLLAPPIVAAAVLLSVLLPISTAEAKCTATSNKIPQLAGSTSQAQVLNMMAKRKADEVCSWDITCPAGSWVGYTNLKLDRLHAGDSFDFTDTETATLLDKWSVKAGAKNKYNYDLTMTRNGVKALYGDSSKVRLTWTTVGSAISFYGFSLTYKCYTTKCPSDLVSAATYSSAGRSGFEIRTIPVAGTDCSWDFQCPNPSDTALLTFAHQGTDWDAPVVNVDNVSMALSAKSGIGSSTPFTVPLINKTASHRMPSSGQGYTVTYSTPSAATDLVTGYLALYTDPIQDWISSNSVVFTVWMGCQPEASTCRSTQREQSTLRDGFGTILSNPGAEAGTSNQFLLRASMEASQCEFKVQCPASATSILFSGRSYSWSMDSNAIASTLSIQSDWESAIGIGAPVNHSFTGAYYTPATPYTWDSSEPAVVSIKQEAAYYKASNDVYYWQTFSGSVSYTCLSPQCAASAQGGLHGQTKALSSTVLKVGTVIPQTDETQAFASDADGSDQNEKLPSEAEQSCDFGVTCPSGFYVMLNVTGTLVNHHNGTQDLISASGGGQQYAFSLSGDTGASSVNTVLGQASLITTTNTLGWTQTAHYHEQGHGYTVTAGCTNFVAGTCPYNTSHFATLSTKGLGTEVTFDNYIASTGASSPSLPTGYACSWPIACPAESYVKVGFGAGALNNSALSFEDASANLLVPSPSAEYGFDGPGLQSLTVDWATTTQWNLTSNGTGFTLTVSCVPVPTPPPTPVPPTPAPPTPEPPTPVPPTPSPPTPSPPTPAPHSPVPPTPVPPTTTPAPGGSQSVPPTPLPPGQTAVPPTPLPPGQTASPPTPSAGVTCPASYVTLGWYACQGWDQSSCTAPTGAWISTTNICYSSLDGAGCTQCSNATPSTPNPISRQGATVDIDDGGLSGGAIGGIAAGAVVVVAIVAVGAFFALKGGSSSAGAAAAAASSNTGGGLKPIDQLMYPLQPMGSGQALDTDVL